MNEIELKRKEKYASHIRTNDEVRKDTADSEPYITDCYANYVFNGNRIGFLFFDIDLSRTEIKSMNTAEDKEIMYIPELEWNKDLAKESKKEGKLLEWEIDPDYGTPTVFWGPMFGADHEVPHVTTGFGKIKSIAAI